MAIQRSLERTGIALTDTFVSGTARRVANLFCALSLRDPSRYHLLVCDEIYQGLNRANYHLENYPNVHELKVRSRLDKKKWENDSLTLEDLGRVLTLRNFRNQIARIVKEEGIKILHAHNDSVYIFGLRPIPGLVQVASLSSIERRNYDRNSLFGQLLRFCLPRYDLVDCLSPAISEHVLAYGVPAGKVFCAPNSFVDVERYKPEIKNPNSVVFATRLHGFKNPDLFVDAIKTTYKEHPQAEFHLLGTGPLRERIANRLHTLEMKDRVHYDFLWDTSKVLNRSSINAQLQQEDNYPSQSLLEGMAAGNAIIATDVGLTRRLVDEKNGILIPLSNASALADAMIWMLKHPEETITMGRRSREKVLRSNNVDNYLSYVGELHARASMLAKRL